MADSSTNLELPDRAKILLSLQQALLGNISQVVRSVDVAWTDDEIKLRFILYDLPSGHLLETISEVEGYLQGDLGFDRGIATEIGVIPSGPIPFQSDPTPRPFAIAFLRSDS